MLNFTEIKKTFCGWTYVRTNGQLKPTLLGCRRIGVINGRTDGSTGETKNIMPSQTLSRGEDININVNQENLHAEYHPFPIHNLMRQLYTDSPMLVPVTPNHTVVNVS